MGHHAFRGVYQQQTAVSQSQRALHLAAKIGVARGINQIDLGNAVLQRDVLGQNRNAALTLKIVRVQYASTTQFAFPVLTRLAQHLVYKRCFAVINVGDDGNVSNV